MKLGRARGGGAVHDRAIPSAQTPSIHCTERIEVHLLAYAAMAQPILILMNYDLREQSWVLLFESIQVIAKPSKGELNN